MDTKDYFLVIGPLVGVMIGGLIATVGKLLELRIGWSAARRTTRIEKLESAFSITGAVTARFLSYPVLLHEIRMAEATKAGRLLAYKKLTSVDLELLVPLASIIEPYTGEVKEAYGEFIGLHNTFDNASHEGLMGNQDLPAPAMIEAFDSFMDAAQKLQNHLQQEIERLEHEPLFRFWFIRF